MTIDHGGNLYGAATQGGNTNCNSAPQGCGVVFQLRRRNSSWTFTRLYAFAGGSDGFGPQSPVLGPDAKLYGTTLAGGVEQFCGSGCGTVFSLSPRATVCGSVFCPWTKNGLYSFQAGDDGAYPTDSTLTFDSGGNLYGTTAEGGGWRPDCEEYGCGTAYELSRSSGHWNETILYSFVNGLADWPQGGVTFAPGGGNLYGTTVGGGAQNLGTIYQLMPGSPWTQTVLHNFDGADDGASPVASLISDSSGNLYGTTSAGGPGGGGTAFELSPAGGSGTFNVIYSFSGPRVGPESNVVMDSGGNLYGTTLLQVPTDSVTSSSSRAPREDGSIPLYTTSRAEATEGILAASYWTPPAISTERRKREE